MYFDVYLDKCYWALILALIMMPLCCFGTPADFWWVPSNDHHSPKSRFVGVGALISTVVGCVIILVGTSANSSCVSVCVQVKEGVDSVKSSESCYYVDDAGEDIPWEVNRPGPTKFTDFGTGLDRRPSASPPDVLCFSLQHNHVRIRRSLDLPDHPGGYEGQDPVPQGGVTGHDG